MVTQRIGLDLHKFLSLEKHEGNILDQWNLPPVPLQMQEFLNSINTNVPILIDCTSRLKKKTNTN